MAADSFEELGLAPELVEALAAEGVERPTEFQEQALPVIRRGNNLVGRAGPGGGTLVTYAAGLLDRLTVGDVQAEGEAGNGSGSASSGPRVLVLVATPDAAHRLAGSAVRLAAAVGLRAASIGGTWVLPERADLLFGSAAAALEQVREGRLSLEGVEALVVDQLTAVTGLSGAETLETLFEFIPRDAQRIVLDLPSGPGAAERAAALADLVERHVRRGVHVPPRAVEGQETPEVPRRGELHFRIVEEPAEEGGMRLVSELLSEGDAHHLVVFFRSEDRAADIGDRLTLHGFIAGAPGDGSAPVWLAVDELATREVLDGPDVADGEVAVLSWDVPPDMDSLDRRHGAGRGGHVLVLPREVAHLRDVARRTGYRVVPAPPPAEDRVPDDLVETVEAIEGALEGEDVGVYMLLLETLFEQHDPAEVAAAAVALLRKKGLPAMAAAAAEPLQPGTAGTGAAPAGPASTGTSAPGRATPWIRLFVSIGSRDDAGPGDIVGAITGETGVDGSKVGRIDIRDSFSIVEVEEPVAERVMRELNGVTVKGRSVRVDYDRPGRGGGTRGRSGPPGGRGPGGPGRDRSPGRGRPGGRPKGGGQSGGSRGGGRDRGS